MEKIDFIKLIEEPLATEPKQALEIKKIINNFPYFQSARVIYLKKLKDSGSFRYNNELKRTAAHTIDRSVLFDFISSERFNKTKNNATEENGKDYNEIKKDTSLIDILEIGKPLNFEKNESSSFNTLLDLSTDNKTISRNHNISQESIIDKFINNSPKIPKIDKSKPFEIKTHKEPEHQLLMTETLAKIYLEQKKYDNAIKAYEILSLKYPEKSGYFADRIKQITKLQKSK